ncbi:hypothetical protein LEP1GSC041_1785 [Leptospira noguchii str. 2006001870]|nr:hypothetical protein LEP1GSC041_1785 [Leptospira noguchii str. 2006001870]
MDFSKFQSTPSKVRRRNKTLFLHDNVIYMFQSTPSKVRRRNFFDVFNFWFNRSFNPLLLK